jgi:predicted ATP-dependent serine protease
MENKKKAIEALNAIRQLPNKDINKLFAIKPMNNFIEDAKHRPIPNKLFHEFWYENEVCILFADTNLGKSLLAMQIANDLSQKMKVLYFDFELSDKQLEKRYSNEFTNHFTFNENLIRAEISTDSDFNEETEYEKYLLEQIEKSIISANAKVVIIDNISYLATETEKQKTALPLMKMLNRLKKQNNISILVLAHTPKRDNSKPIGKNDLAGSKSLINFCDSSFAIGESIKDSSIRYLKHIKVRFTEKCYDENNVCVYEITKANENFLQFEFIGYSTEQEHLKIVTAKDKENIIAKVKELNTTGMSQRLIAKELQISLGTVNKYLKK